MYDKLLVAGDWHGDTNHAYHVLVTASKRDCSAVMQVGDFGYWEHSQDGEKFLKNVSRQSVMQGVPVYFIDGNHENHTMLREKYGPTNEQHETTPEGFWVIRDNVFYIPRGIVWEWSGRRFMGLGGAYSVDRDWRIMQELKKRKPLTLWWPEEELTDDEVAAAVKAGEGGIDVIFTHDKPRGSTPPWDRKDLPECWPNQDRVLEVVKAVQPRLLFHGHLHVRYDDEIRIGDDDKWLKVVGLNCNPDAQMKYPGVQAESYEVLHLTDAS